MNLTHFSVCPGSIETPGPERKANFELLRVLAMIMIVTLHYLDKGGILTDPAEPFTAASYLAWGVESLCIVAVNVYVLISGYFGVQNKRRFKVKKVVKIGGMIWFYSVGIAAICMLTGVIDLKNFNIYELIGYVFPISTEHYWFGTAYVILLVLMPFINFGIAKLGRYQFKGILLTLLLFYCVAPSVLPVQLPYDRFGYDVMWFVILYMIGAYMSVYGFVTMLYRVRCTVLYLLCAGATYGVMLFVRHLYQTTGNWEASMTYPYHYNYVLTLLGAMAFLSIFESMKFKEGKMSRILRRLGSCTFGVYLIHEHSALRYLWPTWFHTEEFIGRPVFLLHMIGTVLTVFFVCTLIEFIRQLIVSAFYKWYTEFKIRHGIETIDLPYKYRRMIRQRRKRENAELSNKL